MSRIFNQKTLVILKEVSQKPNVGVKTLFDAQSSDVSYKDFYNTVFRMGQSGLLERTEKGGKTSIKITPDGEKLLGRQQPKKDGLWKIVIFDIPEKQKYVRVILRAKLKTLHFQKWQNSIWISPYTLDAEIESELKELGKKFFIRLIKTKDINITGDLESMF